VLIGVHLKGAIVDFYEENRGIFTQWTGGANSTNFKEGLIERFALAITKDTWYVNYLNCN